MPEIPTICPICEADISIADREVRLASQHRASGKVLVSCPECCRVLALPEPIPAGSAELEAWITSVEDCCCVPFLNDDVVRIPAGSENVLGKKVYRPGGGGPGLMKRAYMARYGIDPERALAKMGRGEATPFKIGGT